MENDNQITEEQLKALHEITDWIHDNRIDSYDDVEKNSDKNGWTNALANDTIRKAITAYIRAERLDRQTRENAHQNAQNAK